MYDLCERVVRVSSLDVTNRVLIERKRSKTVTIKHGIDFFIRIKTIDNDTLVGEVLDCRIL